MAAHVTTSDDRRAERLNAAFAEEEYEGLLLAARVRLIAVLVIGLWINVENPFPEVLFYYGVVATFALLSVGPLALRKAGLDAPWLRYLFPFLDVSFLTLAVMVPNPLEHEVFPAPMELRFGNEMYMFIFLCASVFSYSPRVVVWTGFAAAAAWSVATLWILALPDSVGVIPQEVWRSLSDEEKIRATLDPQRVFVGIWGRLVVLLLLTSAALAAFVWRVRRLVARQAEAERERANLSRYFSAKMVDELAQSDEPLGTTRQQDIAVLFADMVGFTTLSERLPAAAVIEMLRGFHSRMERAVFDHGGTLDKYIGDGLMATFGTPRSGALDATNALSCARAMVQAVDRWNAEQARRDEAPIRVGVGVHYGSVVMGDIGSQRHLEFAVVGDTVNVASRLERLTRTLSTPVVVSDAAVAAARREGPDADHLLTDFSPGPIETIRGRSGDMRVWQLNRGMSDES